MRALIAVTFLLLAAPAAEASSFSIPANLPESELGSRATSIALADGAVLWMEQRGTAAALVAAGADGVARDVVTLPPVAGPRRFHAVAASGGTAFASRLVCASSSCTRNATRDVLRVDLATNAATPFDSCMGDPGCETQDGCYPALGLRGSVVAVQHCGRQGGVTDLADGAVRHLDGQLLDAAGGFAVVFAETRGESELRVVDWRSGLTVSSASYVYLDPRAEEASLDPDGTLAWAQGNSVVEVLTPGAKQPRTIALEERDAITQVKLAAGLLAVRRADGVNHNQLQVMALDGSGVRRVDGQDGQFGWAFDGTRLAWVAQPCAQTQIQVWDLAGEPPAPVTDRCIRARLVSEPLKLNRAGTRFKVRLTCPPSPARGCAGEVAADVFAGGRKLAEAYWHGFRIPAGGTHTETLRVQRHNRLRGARKLMARVKVDNSSGNATTKRLRLDR